jgi:hypothetical protein
MFAALAGCGRQAPSDGGADPHLALLTKLFADHLNANQGQAPKNEVAFKKYIRQHGAHRLAGVDPNHIESLFVSTRTKKPLVFLYGGVSDPGLTSTVVAYEEPAVDGKRSVGYRYGSAELVTVAAFAELMPTALVPRR